MTAMELRLDSLEKANEALEIQRKIVEGNIRRLNQLADLCDYYRKLKEEEDV